MHAENARMYRVKEVAERSGISAARIYPAVESDQLLGNGTGTLRVTGATILAYPAIGAQAAKHSTPADR